MDEDFKDPIFDSYFFEANFDFNSRDPRLCSNINGINSNENHCDEANLITLHGSDNLIEHTMKDALNKENLLVSELP